MVEINPNESDNLLQKMEQAIHENAVVVVLDKEEVRVLKSMIKDREAFGRVFSWAVYMAGAIVTLVSGWAIISGHVLKWVK